MAKSHLNIDLSIPVGDRIAFINELEEVRIKLIDVLTR
jgi:hypothetical protein